MVACSDSSIKIAVLILAAGSSKRMGAPNKLLLPVGGEPMLRHALRAAQSCGADSVYLLTGYQREQILSAARPFCVREIHNADYERGQNASLAAGMQVLEAQACSVMVLLADQPDVSAELLGSMIRAHKLDGGRRALIPVFDGKKGNPRILPASLVRRIARGAGAFSVRSGLQSGELDSQLFTVDDVAVTRDIDTPEQYQQRRDSQ